MYPPMATEYQPGIGNDIWLLGLSFIEIASIAAAVEIIVGVLKTRPPGMRINLIPLYSWYILVVAAMILFAFPPLIAGDILFELERLLDWPFFDPDRGGDPILWQHLFWVFGHPEVYIIFLPSIALVAMIVPTFARTPMVGYSWIVLAAVGTGFIHVAVDRDGPPAGEGREGRRARPHPAALRLRPEVRRLVGHVHHDARRHDGVRRARLRLLLLLDDPRRLSS